MSERLLSLQRVSEFLNSKDLHNFLDFTSGWRSHKSFLVCQGLGQHVILAFTRALHVSPGPVRTSLHYDLRLHLHLLGSMERNGKKIRYDQQTSVSLHRGMFKIKPNPAVPKKVVKSS